MPVVKQLLLVTLTILALAVPAFAMSEGCGNDCAKCHALTLQEANSLLKQIGTVTEVKPAPVQGLYEVFLEKDGKKGTAYLDYGKKHLVAGQIFDLSTGRLAGAAPAKKTPERIDPATLKTDHTLVMGNPKGKKHLFVFTDPECPFCAKLHGELKKLVAMEPDLAIYIKLFPLKMHPHSYDKARVILGEKSLKLLEKSYAGESLPQPGARDDKKPIDDNIKFGESIGIDATPTLILADGKIVTGFRDAAALKELLK